MNKEHHLIYIPGLHDSNRFNKFFHQLATRRWQSKGFYPHIYYPNWEDDRDFKEILKEITTIIDTLVAKEHIVSLIGQSAGGSAALNAFCIRKDVVNGVVNITGRLKAGKHVTPSLDKAAKTSSTFKESILLLEHVHEPLLTEAERKKIMTIRPLLDQTVPTVTVAVQGAQNKIVPIIEHSLAGGIISIFWTNQWMRFLTELNY
jgi:pimeloyl-ACP methyl ester carboxylesterase